MAGVARARAPGFRVDAEFAVEWLMTYCVTNDEYASLERRTPARQEGRVERAVLLDSTAALR